MREMLTSSQALQIPYGDATPAVRDQTHSRYSAKAYLLSVSITVASMLIALAGFNFVVDPYAMFRAFDRPGFNDQKPSVYNRVRLLKAYEVRRVQPEAIVLGSSRSHVAFRPSQEDWAGQGMRTYNLAFDGALTKEMYFYLRHANAVHPLRQVILSLDTYHPTQAPAQTRPDFDASVLLSDGGLIDRLRLTLSDLRILTSFGTLVDSINTVRARHDGEPVWLAPDGQRRGEVFFHRASEHFETFGPRAYFDEIDKLEVGFKLEWKIPRAPHHSVKTAPAQNDPLTSLDYIRKIVAFCHDHRIDLRIVLTPAHAHQLELTAATGDWPGLEQGKRDLVKLLADDTRQHPDQTPIPLYDFSGYSQVTTEALPPQGTHTEMEYYWDSSHFKENVGDLILHRLFGPSGAGNAGAPADDFGVRLTPENIDHVLAENRHQQDVYRRRVPQDIEVLQSLVRKYKETNHIP